jgi:uncharacterized protein YndB with AHSA1/START domain
MRWWNGEGGPCQVKLWEMEARVGGKFRTVASDPSGKMVINGVSEFETVGKIVEFDPPRVLAYTWSSNFHTKPEHATLVRWELVANQGGTRVKMTHSGLKPLPEGAGYADGWPGVMGWLKSFAEGR